MTRKPISIKKCKDFLVKIRKCAEQGIKAIDSKNKKRSHYMIGIAVRKMRDHIIQHLVVVGQAEIINGEANIITRNPLIHHPIIHPDNDLDLFNENGYDGTTEEVSNFLRGVKNEN